MRKKAQCVFPVILCILLLFSGCGAFNFAQKSNEEGQALSGQGAQDCDSQEKTEGEGAADNLAMWNTDMSVLVSCDDTMHDHCYSAKNMYVWADGQWQRTRRLERIYSETEFYDIPGNGQYPYSDGYRELIYSNGELVEENRIEKDLYEEDIFWFEEESIWSTNYRGGIRLYPEWPEWEKTETTVGGIAMNKYVRKNGNRR